MRETISTTWTFQLIIIFILIFACFLTLVISYSKAYNVKNSVITIVEKYEGLVKNTSLDIISNYLDSNGYRTKGNCKPNWYGISLDGEIEPAKDGKKYAYCANEESNNGKIYYEMNFFYKFNLPFLGELKTFIVSGRTSTFIGNDDRETKE